MSRKSHTPGPVPPGNRPHSGTSYQANDRDDQSAEDAAQDGGFQEEDPKRRLGDFTGTGEHSIQQPGPKNNGGQKHSENG